jgi:hypothetical protein
MGADTIGRVLVTARIENLSDLYKSREGTLSPDGVRTVEVSDALVDTGGTSLCLLRRLIAKLGLFKGKTRRVRTAGGLIDVDQNDTVRLYVQGRECTVDVVAIADDCRC